MQANPSRPDDEGVQRAILSLVLAAHPRQLTIPDLAGEIGGERVEHAIRDLVGIGLLECGGISIRPTAAALRFDRLELP